MDRSSQPAAPSRVARLSYFFPAHNEEANLEPLVEEALATLPAIAETFEIVIVDDGSTDSTWELLQSLAQRIPTLRPVQNTGLHGFGRAIVHGFDASTGDAVVVMMADESDDSRDVVRYWRLLQDGYDAVFGSRFIGEPHRVMYFWHQVANNILTMLVQLHGFCFIIGWYCHFMLCLASTTPSVNV